MMFALISPRVGRTEIASKKSITLSKTAKKLFSLLVCFFLQHIGLKGINWTEDGIQPFVAGLLLLQSKQVHGGLEEKLDPYGLSESRAPENPNHTNSFFKVFYYLFFRFSFCSGESVFFAQRRRNV